MRFFYSVGISIETETKRIEYIEKFGTNKKSVALKGQKTLKKAIQRGAWDHIKCDEGEKLIATIEVHDKNTFELIEILEA